MLLLLYLLNIFEQVIYMDLPSRYRRMKKKKRRERKSGKVCVSEGVNENELKS